MHPVVWINRPKNSASTIAPESSPPSPLPSIRSLNFHPRCLTRVDPFRCAGVAALLSYGRHLLAAVTSISICAPFGSAATATNVRAGSGFGISST